jgi:hypothetical protein
LCRSVRVPRYAPSGLHSSFAMSFDYEVSGLRLRSDIPLAADPAADLTRDIDVTVLAGTCREVPWRRPSAEVIAETFDNEGWPRYSFCAMEDGTTVARFYALADFNFGRDLSSVRCHRHPAVTEAMAGLLVPGNIVSYVLTMAGHYVLHASAVELSPGRAVAFVGSTARGKTTCAALLCAEGCGLVTDDVLVVDVGDGSPRCRRGASSLRLRTQQAELVSRFMSAPAVETTPDGRLAVRPERAGADRPLLDAIVLPSPSRGESEVSARRLQGAEAVGVLLAMPRIEGWRGGERVSQLFEQATAVARAVPVLELTIPWGPPFPADVGARLLEEIARATE